MLKEAIYLREPGYVSDIIFIYAIYLNKDFLSSICESDIINHYNKISSSFAPIDDDFLPFFHIKGGILGFLIDEIYDDPILIKGFNYEHFYNNLCNRQLFKDRLVQFYFEIYDGYDNHSIQEYAEKIEFLEVPDNVKIKLLSFLIAPDRIIDKFLLDIVQKEKWVNEYYTKNEYKLKAFQSGITTSIIANDMKKVFDSNLDIYIDIYYTIRLLSKDHISLRGYTNSCLFFLGSDYKDSIKSIMESDQDIDVNLFGKVISDKNRIQILDMLLKEKEKELSTVEIAKKLSVSATVVYYHLEMMKDSKMLKFRMDGKTMYYRINTRFFNKAIDEMNKYVT